MQANYFCLGYLPLWSTQSISHSVSEERRTSITVIAVYNTIVIIGPSGISIPIFLVNFIFLFFLGRKWKIFQFLQRIDIVRHDDNTDLPQFVQFIFFFLNVKQIVHNRLLDYLSTLMIHIFWDYIWWRNKAAYHTFLKV